MKLSKRLAELLPDGDDGWGVHYRAQRLKADGAPVTLLTVGEHDDPTPAPILDAMDRAARAGHVGYPPIAGMAPLREVIARRVTDRTGVATAPENVLVVPGGQAALFSAHMAALDPGDVGLYIDPYYATYPGTIRGAGGRERAILTHGADGFRPTAEALDAAASGARSLLINSPNNPTGQVYDQETLDTIAETCLNHDLWLISDEVYDTQVWSGSHRTPRALPGMAERTMVVGSLSKSHAMTGSRIGWLIAPEPIVTALADLATVTTYGVAYFVQYAALWALTEGLALEPEVAAPFRRRRDMAAQILAGSSALRALPSDGAMYLMLDIRATGLSGVAFAEALLDAEGIAVMPGESFGLSAAGHIRVAMTIPDDAFADALARMAAFAEACLATEVS